MAKGSKIGKVRIVGQAGCNVLEIELLPTSDFAVTLEVFDTSTGRRTLRGDFPNPINGGGDMGAYVQVKHMYDYLLKQQEQRGRS